jgi:hypothetical protein|tara:strand:- start:1344 stop:3458 length:2115 start_codon:yes stop_codon:yes gene_type:complete
MMSKKKPESKNQQLVSKERYCFKGLSIKEDSEGDIIVEGLVATTHPDREKDILSEKAIDQIVAEINDTSKVGGEVGSPRSVSLFHDWVKQKDPTLDEAAFLQPNAKKVQLPEGHFGAKVEAKLNKHYRGEMDADEIKYRIDNRQIAGFSIEYEDNSETTREVEHDGQKFKFIQDLTKFGGVGFARPRMIANPNAVIYKEIAEKIKTKEESNMEENETSTGDENQEKPEEKKEEPVQPQEGSKEEVKEEEKPSEPATEEKPVEPSEQPEPAKESEEESSGEPVETKEMAEKIVKLALKEMKIGSKIMKHTNREETTMAQEQIPLSVKEMEGALKEDKVDMLRFKEGAANYFAEHPEIDTQLKGMGIPLQSTMKVKCSGNKLAVVGGLKIKTTLDTTTNTGAYTESIVEFADLFIPGLIETFNNQSNLFGALRKVDHLMGGNFYGWKIKTDQAGTLSVDPDDPSVTFNPVDKLKLRTEIKEYRVGVSVTDYVLHHGRATMGDLLLLEAEARMGDMMRDINDDLFTEQVDTAGNQILGLEAVADTAGNTSLYGKTRSTANRLAPGTASDTYNAVGGALTTALIRQAVRLVEVEGARRENLRIIVDPIQRDLLFELEDGNQRYQTQPRFGFEGQISYDGIPVIVDSSAQNDALFVVDWESYYLVISRAPQMIGLAKVGASESAYISVYLAAVYEQPRRIHMLDTLSTS